MNKEKQYLYLSILITVLFFGITPTLSAQNVIKKGKLLVIEGERRSPGMDVVPPLQADGFEAEGIILFKLTDKALKFIKLDDLKNWINSKEFQLAGDIMFTPADVRINDGALRIRYNLDYGAPESAVSVLTKSVTIESRTFSYKGNHNFYRKQIISYTIDISEEPQFDQDIFGALTVSLIGQGFDGASVTIKTSGESEQRATIVNGSAQFTKLKPGNYSVEIRKSGYQTENRSVTVNAGLPTQLPLQLKKETFRLTINSNVYGFDVEIVDSQGGVKKQLGQSSGFVIDLEPGKYGIKLTKKEYDDATQNVDLSSGNKSITITMNQQKQQDIRPEKSSKTWVYLLLLGAAGGGAAYYFTQGGGGSTGTGDYGSPPALPSVDFFKR